MAVRRTSTQTAAARAAQRRQQEQLALRRQQLAQGGVVSPYDGTRPMTAVGGFPLEAGAVPGSLAGLGAARPQVNATNQSALAPNGDVNQHVTNENTYQNHYYNVVTLPQGGIYGGLLGGIGGWGNQCIVDPQTGMMYCRNEGGIIGWIKRLFRGY